jgi:hypothetical protein
MGTKLLTSGLMLVLFFSFYFLKKPEPSFSFKDEKIKGLAFVAPSKEIGDTCMSHVKKTNADWIALMPYGFVPKNSATLEFNEGKHSRKKTFEWWGESPEGTKACIKMAHQKGLKVMMKPHIWLGWGAFTGHLDFKTENEWAAFEKSYLAYLLTFAKIAQDENVELFCIATEMQNHVKKRPSFWKEAIVAIKQVYHGKITYAENWDAYTEVPFWQQLDYVGIDGYFPLSKLKNPDKKNLAKGWKDHLKRMSEFSSAQKRPILFTEIGYRSCDFSTEKPWETDFSLPENENLQAIAYQAFFDEVWQQPYFAGAFIWKWFPSLPTHARFKDTFTPQNKKAELVLKTAFGTR